MRQVSDGRLIIPDGHPVRRVRDEKTSQGRKLDLPKGLVTFLTGMTGE